MVPVPLYATAGADFTAEVSYRGHGRFFFFMENDRTGAVWSGEATGRAGQGFATAESVVERPCLARCTADDATYSALGNFGTVHFVSATANDRPIGDFANYQEDMSSTGVAYGDDLAKPTALARGASSFDVHQQGCS